MTEAQKTDLREAIRLAILHAVVGRDLRLIARAHDQTDEATNAVLAIARSAIIEEAQEEIAELKKALEHSQALVEGKWKEAAKLYLKSAGPNGKGDFEFNMEASIIPLIAEHLAETFKGLGGENYVQIEVNHDELGPLVLTMQRRLGELPASVAAKQKARADAAEAELAALQAKSPQEGDGVRP